MYLTLLKNSKIAVLSVFVVVCSVFVSKNYNSFYELFNSYLNDSVDVTKPDNVFTVNELAWYNGENHKSLYLAVMGTIFDVTKGRKHYKKGASYNYFVGKDGSRALVTGNFQDESNDKDHVLDLTCSELTTVLNWKNTFRDRYTEVGKLIGRYYNWNGDETEYVNELKIKIDDCKYEKELAEREDQMYPPCNVAWSQDKGTKVWCTVTSGGVSRNWVGVPRLLFTPGKKKPRCVCVDFNKVNSAALLKKYDNCSETSTSCSVTTK